MYDNVCSLPLPSDLFALAIHPAKPVVFVGLASGHVHAYRLPSQDDTASATAPEALNSKPCESNTTKPSLVRRISDASDTPSENGFGTVDSLWGTRRHKGSCRALALNSDGSILYSAGTDGLVKAARTDTGQVVSKVAIPSAPKDEPSTLLALNAQVLLLGTDEGKIHQFDLSQNASIISAKPTKTFRPHVTKDEPDNTEAITSMTALAPTAASTSGASRQFISTAGSTLAVTDVHRGTISVSIDQGDLLLSTAVKASPASTLTSTKRKADELNTKPATQDRIFLGTDAGVVSIWDRSKLDDYVGMVSVNRASIEDDGGTIDCLAIAKGGGSANDPALVVAAGLGNGAVRLFQLQGKGGKVIEEVMHDDQGFEGVTALGFEAEGRMISGGGQIVKVWYDNGVEGAVEDVSSDEEEENDDDEDEDEDSDAEDSSEEADSDDEDKSDEEEEEEDSDSDSEEDRKRKKRKRGKDTFSKRHTDSHGITAINGLD